MSIAPSLAIHQSCSFRWSLEQDLALYPQLGVKQIGVWRQKLSDLGEEIGGQLISDAGLQVSSYHWAGGFTGSGIHSFDESLEDAFQAVKMAARLRATCLVVHSGGRGFHMKGHVRRLLKQAYSDLAKYAADENVAIAIEPMPLPEGKEWTVFQSLRDSVDFLKEIDASNLKILLDTVHCRADLNDQELLREATPLLAGVQLADLEVPGRSKLPERKSLGHGQLPLVEIVRALREAGYSGPWELELSGPVLEENSYESLIEENQKAFIAIWSRAGTV